MTILKTVQRLLKNFQLTAFLGKERIVRNGKVHYSGKDTYVYSCTS